MGAPKWAFYNDGISARLTITHCHCSCSWFGWGCWGFMTSILSSRLKFLTHLPVRHLTYDELKWEEESKIYLTFAMLASGLYFAFYAHFVISYNWFWFAFYNRSVCHSETGFKWHLVFGLEWNRMKMLHVITSIKINRLNLYEMSFWFTCVVYYITFIVNQTDMYIVKLE